jgi:hypothetical protein
LREIAEGLVSHEMLDSQEVSPDDEEIDIDFSVSNLSSGKVGEDESAAG